MFIPKNEILVGDAQYSVTDNDNGTKSIELANVILQEATEVDASVLATCIGMGGQTTTFNADGSITETDGTNTKTTVFNDDGSITETLTNGDDTIVKTTVFNDDGSITETLNLGGGN